MLKSINPIISPELLKVLDEMVHSDMILFADGNFPVHSYGIPLIRLDGVSIIPIFESVLPLFPLDSFVENPVTLMQPNSRFGREPSVWASYREIIAKFVVSEPTIRADLQYLASLDKLIQVWGGLWLQTARAWIILE